MDVFAQLVVVVVAGRGRAGAHALPQAVLDAARVARAAPDRVLVVAEQEVADLVRVHDRRHRDHFGADRVLDCVQVSRLTHVSSAATQQCYALNIIRDV